MEMELGVRASPDGGVSPDKSLTSQLSVLCYTKVDATPSEGQQLGPAVYDQ